MATLSVVYPRQPGATFDYDYYQNKHLPLAGRCWGDAGLVGGEALLGKSAPNGSDAPYFAIGILHFESSDALNAALDVVEIAARQKLGHHRVIPGQQPRADAVTVVQIMARRKKNRSGHGTLLFFYRRRFAGCRS